jgi:predicted transporter
MRNKFLGLIFITAGLCITAIVSAQDNNRMEASMRGNEKIYVVMAVCITILIGLIIYVISIDRKIKKIEKKD